MSSTVVETVVRMIESLPESVREQVVEHMRQYIADVQDEFQWDRSFAKKQAQMIAAARRAKQEMAEGRAKPLDYDQL